MSEDAGPANPIEWDIDNTLISNKSDVNAKIPSARSIYVQHVETVKQSGPWNSLGIWAHAEDGDCETVRPMKQSRYSWLSGGYMVVMYIQ